MSTFTEKYRKYLGMSHAWFQSKEEKCYSICIKSNSYDNSVILNNVSSCSFSTNGECFTRDQAIRPSISRIQSSDFDSGIITSGKYIPW